ncbi:MAG: DUF2075 domain-containing protein [Chloroflexi bacterium]|nr:DUF2075 domain-containing protein [Chloroflexota bacterium]
MDIEPDGRISTGLDWLDTMLGGGLANQSLVVLAGVPGSGKSILAFHILAQAVQNGGNAMLVTTTHQPVSKMRTQYSNLSFLGPTGIFDRLEILELDTDIEGDSLLRLLNSIVSRVQEHKVGVAVIDSFRAISDVARSRGQLWRFLGTLSAQLVENNCVGLLVGEYNFPRDLDLPELAMADLVIYLEVDRLVSTDLRTLRIYKMRGGKYIEGRQAFQVTNDGIMFLGSSPEQGGIDLEDAFESIWPAE